MDFPPKNHFSVLLIIPPLRKTTTFVLSIFIFIPIFCENVSIASISFWRRATVSEKLETLSANISAKRSLIASETKIPRSHLCFKYSVRSLMKMLKIFGLPIQPCLVPTVLLKALVRPQFVLTHAAVLL